MHARKSDLAREQFDQADGRVVAKEEFVGSVGFSGKLRAPRKQGFLILRQRSFDAVSVSRDGAAEFGAVELATLERAAVLPRTRRDLTRLIEVAQRL